MVENLKVNYPERYLIAFLAKVIGRLNKVRYQIQD